MKNHYDWLLFQIRTLQELGATVSNGWTFSLDVENAGDAQISIYPGSEAVKVILRTHKGELISENNSVHAAFLELRTLSLDIDLFFDKCFDLVPYPKGE